MRDLVAAHPYVRKAIGIDTKKWKKSLFSAASEIAECLRDIRYEWYDAVFDLQGNCKSGVLTLLARSEKKVGFGWSTIPEWPNLIATNERINPPKNQNIRRDYLYLLQKTLGDFRAYTKAAALLRIKPEEEEKIMRILSDPNLKQIPRIMICPGSNWPNKQMNTFSLIDLLTLIDRSYAPSFLLVYGSPQEKAIVTKIQGYFPENSKIIDKLSLPALQNLMAKVQLVLAMDSLPLHLAGITKTPTFSIFGASLAAKYQPEGNEHKSYQGSCPYQKTFEKRCKYLRTCKTGLCIQGLQAKPIFHTFSSWWKNLHEMANES